MQLNHLVSLTDVRSQGLHFTVKDIVLFHFILNSGQVLSKSFVVEICLYKHNTPFQINSWLSLVNDLISKTRDVNRERKTEGDSLGHSPFSHRWSCPSRRWEPLRIVSGGKCGCDHSAASSHARAAASYLTKISIKMWLVYIAYWSISYSI